MDGVESDNSDGVTMDELKASLAEVRSRKAILKQRHKLKGKLIHNDKKVKAEDMIEHFQSIGVPVNAENIRSRSKAKKSIIDYENAQDRKAKDALDSDDGEMPIDDEKLADAEADARGRKRRREKSVNPDDYMDIDEDAGAKKRTMTPS